jgi:hypothetical protein
VGHGWKGKSGPSDDGADAEKDEDVRRSMAGFITIRSKYETVIY